MAPLVLTIELVPLVHHTEKRAVAILRGHGDLTAATEYDKVAETPLGKRLKHRMGLWIALHPDTKGKFHRFKNLEEKYKHCIAFIDLDAQIRLYGFTCHPTPNTNKGFELAVLTDYAVKKTHLTDTAYLNRVLMWQNHMSTEWALEAKYPDKKDVKK